MKLAILGDTHFGKGYSIGKIDSKQQLNTRLLDYINTMNFVIDHCRDNKISHLIITGDIFEHKRPEASQTKVFSKLISRLMSLNIHTHIVVGNHDIIRDSKTTTVDMFAELNLPLINIWTNLRTVHIGDENNGLNIIFMPYCTRQMLQCFDNESAVKILQNKIKNEIKSIKNNDPIFIVGHFTLLGAQSHGILLNSNVTSDIILPIKSFPSKVDAIIMGHIHQHQIVSKKPYALHIGSMERSNFREGEDEKYLLEIENLKFTYRSLPTRKLCDIVLDCSDLDLDSNIEKDIKEKIIKLDKNINDSICRIEIIIDECMVNALNTNDIKNMIKKEFNIYHCANIFYKTVSKKQLRSSEITEKTNIKSAFYKWLEMEEDENVRKNLEEAGNKIIEELKGI